MPQPDQPTDQQAAPPADPHAEQTPTQSFTGKIVKDSGKYALKVGTKTYQLEQQEGLQKYESQTVRVVGSLNATGNTIHILKLDLLS